MSHSSPPIPNDKDDRWGTEATNFFGNVGQQLSLLFSGDKEEQCASLGVRFIFGWSCTDDIDVTVIGVVGRPLSLRRWREGRSTVDNGHVSNDRMSREGKARAEVDDDDDTVAAGCCTTGLPSLDNTVSGTKRELYVDAIVDDARDDRDEHPMCAEEASSSDLGVVAAK